MSTTTITSSSNPRIRDLLRLQTSRGRKQQSRIVVYGNREAARFCESGGRAMELFVKQGSAQPAWLAGIEHQPPVFELAPDLFHKVQYGSREDSVILVAKRPEPSLEKFRPASGAPLLVLDAIEKPGNIGAIFRTADAAGASGILLTNPCCDLFHPNAIRASMATVFSVPAAICDVASALQWLTVAGRKVFALRIGAHDNWFACDLNLPLAIVLGNESEGLGPDWEAANVVPTCLPMRGLADSLNVSTTAAICLYEACRQQGHWQ